MRALTVQIVIAFILLLSCQSKKENAKQEVAPNKELTWLYEWLAAWELISCDVFKLEESNPPEMLFFDDKYVYTNSPTSAPDGQRITGPQLYGKEITWLKQSHNDTITIPDGSQVPIQIMTFAAPSRKEDIESFFVMAAPSFWKNAGIESEEVGLSKMLTGVFLHEFAHTRQMNGIGATITAFEKNYTFDYPVSDDIVQEYFSQDSSYVRLFTAEIESIYSILEKQRRQINPADVKNVLQALKNRQEKYLKRKNEILPEMDRIFLTMEGIGQYAMVSWLTHPDGGAMTEETAIKATRRSKRWWSQDEGLALVLLYKKIAKDADWNIMFSKQPTDIIKLIELEMSN